MKVVILATEPSGDFLGSELMKIFNKKNISVEGVGGELMRRQGLKSWISINKFNAIGIYEVMIRIFKFIKLLKNIEKKIRKSNPDILFTIDSPSFSYRIVSRLQDLRKNTQFIHYVAPTVWAWKSYRAKIFAKIYDKIFTLFDFEPQYFLKHGLDAKFVGHPIFFQKMKSLKRKKIILFFPGSRTVEIKNNMKKLREIILTCSLNVKGFKIYILTLKQHVKLIEKLVDNQRIKIVSDLKVKHNLMRESHLAVAASGSVTLELIKYETPTIVFYETHWLTKKLIKLLVKVKFASIINIIHKKMIIPEFLFEDFNTRNVIKEINKWLNDEDLRSQQVRIFREFSKKMLNKNVNPSELIIKHLKI